METNFTLGEQKRAQSTQGVGKPTPTSDLGDFLAPTQLWEEAETHGFPHLSRLRDDLISQSLPGGHNQQPIDFAQLEMLEAELCNQGILPGKSDGRLFQHALHETNVWRWRAQRYGFDPSQLQFKVNLAEYILARASRLIALLEERNRSNTEAAANQAWTLRFERQSNVLSELRYLEDFAAFLYGAFDSPANRYQRGLNLILKVLLTEAEPPTQAKVTEKKQPQMQLVLPLTKQHFFRVLKQYRQSQF